MIQGVTDPNVRHALDRSGLIRITQEPGVVWNNPVEPTHVDSVELVSGDWGKIEKETGFTKAAVDGMFDELEKLQL